MGAVSTLILILTFNLYMAHSINSECGVRSTIATHDMHCKYVSQISLLTNDYTDRWQITYPSIKQLQSSLPFEQFVFIKITTNINTSLLIEPLIRESCDYSFQTDLSFKSALSSNEKQMIYTVILPSCNTETLELCTYYIVVEASNKLLNGKQRKAARYELSASLGVLLQFQQKYSYSTIESILPNKTQPNKLISNDDAKQTINSTCIHSQFYGLKASLTDFPLGIIVQPEFIDTDASFSINEYTSSPNSQINVKQVNALKGDAESASYDVPPSGDGYISSSDYILLHIIFSYNSNLKYTIYSQSNISYIQVSVINSGGWFLMLILVVLILIAMCRKHCCLRHDNQRLSYNDIVRNIQLQNPLFNSLNSNAGSDANSSNKAGGITCEQLNNVSVIEIYHKHRLHRGIFSKHKQKNKTKYSVCCICLYDYKNNDKIRKLKCNHSFHQKCIDIWFNKNIQCPLCKQSVINAQILSKRSNTTQSDTSSLITDTSTSTSTARSSESTSTATPSLSATHEKKIENNNNNNIYSLSDSHCIYAKGTQEKIPAKHVCDDLYISRRSNMRNRYSQSYSGSHQSSSSNASEIVNNNIFTITNTTNTTATTNDISTSISPITNDLCDDVPLSTFISLSLSNQKRE